MRTSQPKGQRYVNHQRIHLWFDHCFSNCEQLSYEFFKLADCSLCPVVWRHSQSNYTSAGLNQSFISPDLPDGQTDGQIYPFSTGWKTSLNQWIICFSSSGNSLLMHVYLCQTTRQGACIKVASAVIGMQWNKQSWPTKLRDTIEHNVRTSTHRGSHVWSKKPSNSVYIR